MSYTVTMISIQAKEQSDSEIAWKLQKLGQNGSENVMSLFSTFTQILLLNSKTLISKRRKCAAICQKI